MLANGGTMNRPCGVVTVALLAIVACTPSAKTREAERLQRSIYANQISVVTLALRNCGGNSACETPAMMDDLANAEREYRAACEACAAADKCEHEIRRIRHMGSTAANETACP
jgi:hypothetical protein